MSVDAARNVTPPAIGGLKPVFLSRAHSSQSKTPEFLGMTLLPGRGMNVFQIRACFPGLGELHLLASPSLEEARQQLSGDFMGVHSFRFGGALLVPFANRVRGRLLLDNCTIETEILGRDVRLPADWDGKHSGAEKCAIHGLILASKFHVLEASDTRVSARLGPNDFGAGGYRRRRSRLRLRCAGNTLALL